MYVQLIYVHCVFDLFAHLFKPKFLHLYNPCVRAINVQVFYFSSNAVVLSLVNVVIIVRIYIQLHCYP